MSGSDFKENRNNDYPRITEADWYVLAISLAIMTFVIATGGLLWIFYAVGAEELQKRLAITGMITTFLGATTTFCTVAWRGMITSKQSDTSIEQVKETRRQIAVTEVNNLAATLVRGAELIGETKSSTKVAAGIATLHSVVVSGNRNFAIAAQSLIMDYIEQNSSHGHENNLVNYAISIINQSYSETNLILNRAIVFSIDENVLDDREFPFQWKLLHGAERIIYNHGIFDFFELYFHEGHWYSFTEVDFAYCELLNAKFIRFTKCNFRECSFDYVNEYTLHNQDFSSCDFSGTFIDITQRLPDLRHSENYYHKDNPPIASNGAIVDWKLHFIERE